MLLRYFVLVMALVALAGCSRKVSVAPEPGTTYSVLVTNHTGGPMNVSWSDGDAWRPLGPVANGDQARFIIAAPRQTTISIRGMEGTRTSGPYTVTLTPGGSPRVTLR